jgi:hypothetical protein
VPLPYDHNNAPPDVEIDLGIRRRLLESDSADAQDASEADA